MTSFLDTPEGRQRVAEHLNRLPFVAWDRLVDWCLPGEDDHHGVSAFGWVDRPDGRADFVLVAVSSWDPDHPGFNTSSAALSELIGETLNPGQPHFPCQRVEHALGDLVENKIVLDPLDPIREALEAADGWRFHPEVRDAALAALEWVATDTTRLKGQVKARDDAHERLRQRVTDRPLAPEGQARGYSDGFTSGLIEALHIVREPEFEELQERQADEARIPWSGTLLVEGEASSDGRSVAVDATEWITPIFLHEVRGTRSERIGVIDEVWREDNLIRASGYALVPVTGRGVGADLRVDAYEVEGEPPDCTTRITKARLVAATIMTHGRQAFPHARID